MKIRIIITLKNGVLDPQGQAITSSLQQIGFEGVHNALQGKVIDLDVDIPKEHIDDYIAEACQKLLVNSVIENYSYDILEA